MSKFNVLNEANEALMRDRRIFIIISVVLAAVIPSMAFGQTRHVAGWGVFNGCDSWNFANELANDKDKRAKYMSDNHIRPEDYKNLVDSHITLTQWADHLSVSCGV